MSNGKNYYADVYAGSMGNFIIITVISCMALSAVLSQTGVITKIANWFITRKSCEGHPYTFLAMFILSFFVIGTFMEATAVTIMYINLASEICKKLGYKKGDKFYTVMMCSIYWGNAVVSAGSPISHVLPLLLIAAAAPALGVTISFGQWLMVGIPFEIVSYIVIMLIIRFIWKLETEKFSAYDVEAMKQVNPPLSREGKITTVIFILVVAAWLFPQFGSSFAPGVTGYLNQIGACVPPILALALVCIIHVDGKPIARFPELVITIPMGLLIFTATVTVLGAAVNLDTCGISTWLYNLLSPILEGLPTLVIMAILVLGAMIGVLTPAAAVPAPLFFGPEHITVQNTLKYALIYLVLTFISIMVIIWPLANILIKF